LRTDKSGLNNTYSINKNMCPLFICTHSHYIEYKQGDVEI